MAISAAQIERIGSQIRELMGVDVSALSRDEFLEQLEAAATLEKIAGAFSARYAADVKRRSAPEEPGGGFARREGHGNAGNMISTFTGGSVARAMSAMEAGDAFTPVPVPVVEPELLSKAGAAGDRGPVPAPAPPPAPVTRPKYPLVAAAQTAGAMSIETAAVIVEGLNLLRDRVEPDYLDSVEAAFVEKSAGLSVHQMKRVVSRAIAKVDQKDLVKRERRHHEERYFWWKQDVSGMVTFHGKLDAVTAAPIITVIEQLATRDVRKQSRDEQAPGDDKRTVGQIRADALHELARHALGCGKMHKSGVRTSVVVRVDKRDLERQTGLATIDGIETPVSLEAAGMCCGDAEFVMQFVDTYGNVLHQNPQHRKFTQKQRRRHAGTRRRLRTVPCAARTLRGSSHPVVDVRRPHHGGQRSHALHPMSP
ncbi:DUF222 domain-containing protein [Demequina sp. NBRC 110055]|uniref:DUF222 domain-containing protein n=1 Tax=Demequina sp. NBRC 110055 TaxID=1570344 RepID=UPI0009FDAE35|nr:DUF222 domain-containing protein [Demequina sp. NBRC 110055]